MSDSPSVGKKKPRRTTNPTTDGARRGVRARTGGAPQNSLRSTPPPHQEGSDNEGQIADRRQKPEQLIEPAEELTFMRGDADVDDASRRGGNRRFSSLICSKLLGSNSIVARSVRFCASERATQLGFLADGGEISTGSAK